MYTIHDIQPKQIVEITDDALGNIGFVIIDRPVNGSTAGGIRFSSDVTEEEVTRLARVMTFKWGFLNLPMGGGKAGIRADLQKLGCDRTVLMEAYGRSIAPLVQEHVFYPGVDLGTTMDDLEIIMREAGTPLQGEQIDSSYCTALTVFETIRQLGKFLDIEFNEMSYAIEGFGKVGSELAGLLAAQGAKLVGVSTRFGAIYSENGLDVVELFSLKKIYDDRLVEHYRGADAIPLDALFVKPVDLLVPGARPNAINGNNVDQIKARMIVPIANIPFAPQIEEKLSGRGVLIVPDFVANCGGILASGMHGYGFNIQDASYLVENTFSGVVREILRIAKLHKKTVREIAEAVAWQNHESFLAGSSRPKGRMTRIVEMLMNKGLKGLMRRIAWRIFQRYPSSKGLIRRAAVGRYGEMGLDLTRDRIRKL